MDPSADPGPLAPAQAPTPTERRRATVKELRERTELVRRQLLTGATRHTIQLLIVTDWGVSTRTARWYVRRAEAEIRKAAERDKDAWLAEHVAIRRDIRRRASAASDLRSELAAAESEAKLLGIEPATRLEHSGPGGGAMISEVTIRHHALATPAAHPPPVGPPADGGGREPAGGELPPGPDAGVE